jgi:hypothetical protein
LVGTVPPDEQRLLVITSTSGFAKGATMRVHPAVCALFVLPIFLAGCDSLNPHETTVADGLESVGDGLYRLNLASKIGAPPPLPEKGMDVAEVQLLTSAKAEYDKQKANPPKTNFGLFAHRVVVTLNVTNSKSNSKSLVVTASASAPGIPVSGSFTGSDATTTSYLRANTITVTLDNPLFETAGSLIHDTVTGNPPAAGAKAATATDTTAKTGEDAKAPTGGGGSGTTTNINTTIGGHQVTPVATTPGTDPHNTPPTPKAAHVDGAADRLKAFIGVYDKVFHVTPGDPSLAGGNQDGGPIAAAARLNLNWEAVHKLQQKIADEQPITDEDKAVIKQFKSDIDTITKAADDNK